MDFYERYWKRTARRGVGFAALPPDWGKEGIAKIKSIIKPYLQEKVLDVGCGDGTLTYELSKLDNVKRTVGVDISNIAISRAREKYSNIEFKNASVTKLPFPKESFDFITAVELVEHVVDVERMFKEFNRVLRLGGRLFITTTDFNLLKKITIALFFWEKYFYPTNPHIRFFTKSTLEDILSRTEFQIIKYTRNGSYFGIMPKGQIVIAEKFGEMSSL